MLKEVAGAGSNPDFAVKGSLSAVMSPVRDRDVRLSERQVHACEPHHAPS